MEPTQIDIKKEDFGEEKFNMLIMKAANALLSRKEKEIALSTYISLMSNIFISRSNGYSNVQELMNITTASIQSDKKIEQVIEFAIALMILAGKEFETAHITIPMMGEGELIVDYS